MGPTHRPCRPPVLGSIGKIDNGVVSVHTLWANEERYYPIEVEPYTPAPWFALGKNDPEFRSKRKSRWNSSRTPMRSAFPSAP